MTAPRPGRGRRIRPHQINRLHLEKLGRPATPGATWPPGQRPLDNSMISPTAASPFPADPVPGDQVHPTLPEPAEGSTGITPVDAGVMFHDRYELNEMVGRGGTATVYRGTDTLLQRTVAIKVFHPNPPDPVVAIRQRREMRVVAGVNHPNLVTVYDAHPAPGIQPSSSGGTSYLVTEYVDGPSLAQRLKASLFTVDEVLRIGIGVAQALVVVHDLGLVHRDVKPANVLIGASGQVKLADFGIARSLTDDPVTKTDDVVGTAPYLSPEQVTGHGIGPASDVYSLGLVLLECLTGQREFPGPTAEAALARLVRNPDVPDTLPPPLPSLLRSMTNRNPERRPTAREIAAVLAAAPHQPVGESASVTTSPAAGGSRSAEPHTPVTVRTPAGQPAAARGRRRHLFSMIAAVVAAVVMGTFLGVDHLADPTESLNRESTIGPVVTTPTGTSAASTATPAPAAAEPTTGARLPVDPVAVTAPAPVQAPTPPVPAQPPAPEPPAVNNDAQPPDDPERAPAPGNSNSNGNGNGNGNGSNQGQGNNKDKPKDKG